MLSITKLAQVCGLPGLPTIYRQLKRDAGRGMRLETLGRIEQALNITIIEKGDKLTYRKNGSASAKQADEYGNKINAQLQALEQYTSAVRDIVAELAKNIGGITLLSDKLNKLTEDIARRYQDIG